MILPTDTTARSFMVVRPSEHSPTGTSYTGPFRTAAGAQREADAWTSSGRPATVQPYTSALKAEVRAWEAAKRARNARS